jgi:hypothetical protein
MDELPPDLLAALPDGAGPVAEQWWASLSEADRRRVAGLWDERLEVSFFAPQADADGCVDQWEQVPAVAGGRPGARRERDGRRRVVEPPRPPSPGTATGGSRWIALSRAASDGPQVSAAGSGAVASAGPNRGRLPAHAPTTASSASAGHSR